MAVTTNNTENGAGPEQGAENAAYPVKKRRIPANDGKFERDENESEKSERAAQQEPYAGGERKGRYQYSKQPIKDGATSYPKNQKQIKSQGQQKFNRQYDKAPGKGPRKEPDRHEAGAPQRGAGKPPQRHQDFKGRQNQRNAIIEYDASDDYFSGSNTERDAAGNGFQASAQAAAADGGLNSGRSVISSGNKGPGRFAPGDGGQSSGKAAVQPRSANEGAKQTAGRYAAAENKPAAGRSTGAPAGAAGTAAGNQAAMRGAAGAGTGVSRVRRETATPAPGAAAAPQREARAAGAPNAPDIGAANSARARREQPQQRALPAQAPEAPKNAVFASPRRAEKPSAQKPENANARQAEKAGAQQQEKQIVSRGDKQRAPQIEKAQFSQSARTREKGGKYSHSQQGHSHRIKAEETLEEIKTDIVRIEKEIDLEILEIQSLKLAL